VTRDAAALSFVETGELDVERAAAWLARCRDVDDVRDVRDKARAIEIYQRARGASLAAQQDAAEIALRAERRLGELCVAVLTPGRKRSHDATVSLSDLGISKSQSSRWQKLAAIPESDFVAHVGRVRERGERLTTSGTITATSCAEHARAVALSQWNTPDDLARRMVELAELAPNACVLEPSAGTGAIVRAVREALRYAHVTAYELDPALLEDLREHAQVVHEGDFLAAPIPSRRYDASIQNSPYEGGLDGRFLERAMACAGVVVALLRTNALHGSDEREGQEGRYEQVWSKVSAGQWALTHLRYLRKRPQFESAAATQVGAKSDFVVVRLELAEDGFARRGTDVDWW